MVFTRRQSSRLQSTPQRGRASQASETSSPQPALATPQMPTLSETEEPAELSTPLATPQPTNKPISFLPAFMARTPKNKTPLKPSGEEMHPDHHHLSTAKPLDEARWLGFLNMGARTEPVKKGVSKIPITQATPTKAQESTPVLSELSTPEFKFRFRRQSLELSPEAQKLMEESRHEAQKIRAQMATNPEEFGIEKNEDIQRKIAKPKGKASRFSDVHMAQFKKMDSIANHPSAFRLDPNRSKPGNTALKRSPSKAELDKPEKSPLKSPAKLTRLRSTVSLNKPQADGAPGPAKRVKRNEGEDASAARPRDELSKDGETTAPKTGIPRLASKSNLMTPTKATLARSQSVKTLKKTTMIPMLPRSPSIQNVTTPSKPKTHTPFKDGLRKASQTVSRLPSMKSILRAPIRHYSNDPLKIAAGTHVATPPDFEADMPDVPATEPVQKKVNFTESTLAKLDIEKQKNKIETTPKPAERASSEVPEQPSDVTYPELSFGSPTRRSTMDGAPGDFTFRSDRSISFGPAITGPTIRKVRTSDVTATLPDPFNTKTSNTKRKLNVPEGVVESEKENDEEDGGRPTKRAKATAPQTPAKTPARKAPQSTLKRRTALSQARLNLLAQPKRRV